MRLRTQDGQIANQYDTHKLLIQYVHDTWKGPAVYPALTSDAPGVPFDVQELEQAVSTMQPTKAVAPPFLPAAVWQSSPHAVAHWLYPLLESWWNQYPPHVPRSWRDSWVIFLPKPGKLNRSPSDLRPISLTEPLGKMVLGIINHH